MKITLILIALFTSSLVGLPPDVVELTEKRDSAISVINQKYKKALEVLKVKYTKKVILRVP